MKRPTSTTSMFDFSFGELAVIGAVALVVLGPERPRVARTVGEWAGKAQRYVAQVKADINREVELADLKKLQDEARDVARDRIDGAREHFKPAGGYRFDGQEPEYGV